ncbi:Hypothetical protein, putative [Bodo saltans]|uniref:Uncharacterized protein n=1 Tax=Bodo saltans TaxID=75058 RepID=A0A0S4IJU1_BODSA|nr:Hypothetical protein, putative [Bodo saltans]|eukprot:CUE94180.1 Hypothetical protein, putative [Bodo saltans]
MFFAKFASTAATTSTSKLAALYQRCHASTTTISSQSQTASGSSAPIQDDEIFWAIQQPIFLEDLEHGHAGAHRLINTNLDLLLEVVYSRLEASVGRPEAINHNNSLDGNSRPAATTKDDDSDSAVATPGDNSSSYTTTPRCGSVSPRMGWLSHLIRQQNTAEVVSLAADSAGGYDVEQVSVAALRALCGRSAATPRKPQSVFEYTPTQQTPWGDLRTTRNDEVDRRTVSEFVASGSADAWVSALESIALHALDVVLHPPPPRDGASQSTSSSISKELTPREALQWVVMLLEIFALIMADLLEVTHLRQSPPNHGLHAEVVERTLSHCIRILVQLVSNTARSFPTDVHNRTQLGTESMSPDERKSDAAAQAQQFCADPFLRFATALRKQVFHTHEMTMSINTLALLCCDCSSLLEAVTDILQLLACRHQHSSRVLGVVLQASLPPRHTQCDTGYCVPSPEEDHNAVVVLLRHILSVSFVSRFPPGSVGESHMCRFLESFSAENVRRVSVGMFGLARRWTDVVCGVDDHGKGMSLLQELYGLNTAEGAVGAIKGAASPSPTGHRPTLHADELDDTVAPDRQDDDTVVCHDSLLAAPSAMSEHLMVWAMQFTSTTTSSLPPWMRLPPHNRGGSHHHGTAATTACHTVTARLLQEACVYESASLHRHGILRCRLAALEKCLYDAVAINLRAARGGGVELRNTTTTSTTTSTHTSPSTMIPLLFPPLMTELRDILDEWLLLLNPIASVGSSGLDSSTRCTSSSPTASLVVATSATLHALIMLAYEVSIATLRASTVAQCAAASVPSLQSGTKDLVTLAHQLSNIAAPRLERVMQFLSSPCQTAALRSRAGKLGPALLTLSAAALRYASPSTAAGTPGTVDPSLIQDAVKLAHGAFRVECGALASPLETPAHQQTTEDFVRGARKLSCLTDLFMKVRCSIAGLRGPTTDVVAEGRTAAWCKQRFLLDIVALSGGSGHLLSSPTDSINIIPCFASLSSPNGFTDSEAAAAAAFSGDGEAATTSTDLFAAWDNNSQQAAERSVDEIGQQAPHDFPTFGSSVGQSITVATDVGEGTPPRNTVSQRVPHHRTLSGAHGVLSPTSRGPETVGGTLDLFAMAPVSWER